MAGIATHSVSNVIAKAVLPQASLSLDNAVERLMLGDELGIASLKKACAQFLAKPETLAEAQGTEPWARLVASRSHLALEVHRQRVQAGAQTLQAHLR